MSEDIKENCSICEKHIEEKEEWKRIAQLAINMLLPSDVGIIYQESK